MGGTQAISCYHLWQMLSAALQYPTQTANQCTCPRNCMRRNLWHKNGAASRKMGWCWPRPCFKPIQAPHAAHAWVAAINTTGFWSPRRHTWLCTKVGPDLPAHGPPTDGHLENETFHDFTTVFTLNIEMAMGKTKCNRLVSNWQGIVF